MVGLGDLIMPLIICDLFTVNLISTLAGNQLNHFQWDSKRIEAKARVVLKRPKQENWCFN